MAIDGVAPRFNFDNSFARELEGFYVPWKGSELPAPTVLRLNVGLARELGLDPDVLETAGGAQVLSGSVAPEGGAPLAMAYAGHQFGGFSPQLGDGRALLIGEVIDRVGNRHDIHLKGSGPTPFSRGGDGKAVLGPVLREYLIGEAMHALGIPTTRALAAVLTGESIYRNGAQPGAVLARVASSHLRVGTFQFFAVREETEKIRELADYAIARHYPELVGLPDRYISLLRSVCDAQAELVAKWMHVGFVHGVMNTDNTTISGETIDYGPCAFIDAYDSGAVFSSIDEHGRYAYGNQPYITQWNLARFAETLLDVINPDDSKAAAEQATEVLGSFATTYETAWLAGMRKKLGLSIEEAEDLELAHGLFDVLQGKGVDYTRFFRALSSVTRGDAAMVRTLFGDPGDVPVSFNTWLESYRQRLSREKREPLSRAAGMDAVNPVYIPRNHMVEEALDAAVAGDLSLFDALLGVVTAPFVEQEGRDEYAQPAPDDFGRYVTYCGT